MRVCLRNKVTEVRGAQSFMTLDQLTTKSLRFLSLFLPLVLWWSTRSRSNLKLVHRRIIEKLTDIHWPALEELVALEPLDDIRWLVRSLCILLVVWVPSILIGFEL